MCVQPVVPGLCNVSEESLALWWSRIAPALGCSRSPMYYIASVLVSRFEPVRDQQRSDTLARSHPAAFRSRVIYLKGGSGQPYKP